MQITVFQLTWISCVLQTLRRSGAFLQSAFGYIASGLWAVCKVEWKPLAAKWLKDRQAILHTAAKSYASKISGVLHDRVVHKTKRMRRILHVSRRASKVGGVYGICLYKLLTLCVYSWKHVEDSQILHIALVSLLLFFPPAFNMITSHTLKNMYPPKKKYIYPPWDQQIPYQPALLRRWFCQFCGGYNIHTFIYLCKQCKCHKFHSTHHCFWQTSASPPPFLHLFDIGCCFKFRGEKTHHPRSLTTHDPTKSVPTNWLTVLGCPRNLVKGS